MKLPRRTFLYLAAGAVALPAGSRIARAQNYPSRPVRLIVPFPAGGGQDAVGRLLANRLSEIWQQQVVVENRGGASGNIGNQAATQSSPDGYTILFGSPSLAISPHIYPSLGYSPIADLEPVTLVGAIPNAMAVPNSSPAKSVQDFITLASKNPGKLTFASSGVGASPHLSGELLKKTARIEILHIPYRGVALALNDVLAGRIDAYFANLPGLLPHMRSGTLRVLAVTSAKRSPSAPELPTFVEAGVPGYEVSAWSALFVPAKTAPELVAKIREDTISALAIPSVIQKFSEQGVEVATSTPTELAAYLKAETDKWGPIIREANIKPE